MSIIEFSDEDDLFDIMAKAYKEIIPYDSNKIARFYYPEDYSDIYKEIKIYCESLYKGYEFSINELKNKFKKIIENIDVDKLCFVYYSIIMAIDQNIEYKLKISENGEIFNNYNSLNKNSGIGVHIYVKINNSIINTIDENILNYEKKNSKEVPKTGLRPKYAYNPKSINCSLDNYIILEKYELGDYEIHFHELIDEDILFNRISSSGQVRIGIVPFIDHNIESMLKVETENNSFWVDGAQEKYKDIFIERFKIHIESLLNENVDFIIFPEMLLIREVVNIIGEYIENLSYGNTKIILLGSISENHSNSCNVYDNFGELVFKQHKKTSFIYKNKYEELLDNSDKRIHVLDIKGVGRIFTFICKDLSNDELMRIPKQLGADIIMFPAFSGSLDMEEFSCGFSATHNCINIFANTCAAFGKKDERVSIDVKKSNKKIGYVTLPAKKDRKSNSIIKHYNFSSSCVECCNICHPRILSINMEKIVFENDTYSCEMEYSEIP
jgi:Predicted amidohydrolase